MDTNTKTIDWNSFLLQEKVSRDIIDFKVIYVDMAGDLLAGLLLSQIVYWYLPNKQGLSKLRVHKQEKDWIAKKREEWWDEIRLTPKQFDRACKLLIQRKIISTKNFRFNGSPTKHISLNTEQFLAIYNACLSAKSNLTKGKEPTDSNVNMQIDGSVKTLTENTNTEITQRLQQIDNNSNKMIEDTFLLKEKQFFSVEDLSQSDFEEVAEKYHVPVAFVLSKYDDMCLWAGEPRNQSKCKGRDWKLTLMRWVKNEAVERRDKHETNAKIFYAGDTVAS